MTLQEIYYIAEMVVGVAVIISIVLVAIELRQNTRMMRKSTADQRRQHFNWVYETTVTDNDVRAFQLRIDRDWDQLNENERYRAWALGMRTIRSLLDELAAYFDGQLSVDEWNVLSFNLDFLATRPNVQLAYDFVKTSYSERVQKYWEALDNSPKAIITKSVQAS